jgi:hypothetical protein
MRRLFVVLVALSCLAWQGSAGPYTIPGFRPGVNVDGINTSYTYVPFDNSSDGFKDEWFNRLAALNPKSIRFMDWNQTNGSPFVNWSDRSKSDTYEWGTTYETDIRLAQKLNATPWVNIPHMATDDYAFQMGKLFGQSYKNGTIKVEYSNELWFGGDQRQGTWNLFRAREDPQYVGSDTEKMAQRAAWVGYQRIQKFKEGLASVGSSGVKVEWEWGGFVVNPYWTQWGMEFLKKKGVDPSKQNIRLAIAPYAPGSETDIPNLNPGTSYAQGQQIIKDYVNNTVLPWIEGNKNMAQQYGLLGVDGYEARVASSYAVQRPEMKNWWLGLQDDPGMRELQRDYWNKLVRVMGTDATINIFGLYGIPHSEWGQWPLLDINELNNPGPNYIGTQDVIDAVPEPAGLALLGLGLMFCRRPRR